MNLICTVLAVLVAFPRRRVVHLLVPQERQENVVPDLHVHAAHTHARATTPTPTPASASASAPAPARESAGPKRSFQFGEDHQRSTSASASPCGDGGRKNRPSQSSCQGERYAERTRMTPTGLQGFTARYGRVLCFTWMVLMYNSRCEVGTKAKLMVCAGIHTVHDPITAVARSFLIFF